MNAAAKSPAEHTPSPGPWRMDRGEIVAADGEIIGEVYRSEAWSDGDPIASEDQANAAFIVKAVNSHDALVKALEEIIAAYDSGNLQMRSPEIGEPENGIPYHEWHEEWLHFAREALTTARTPADRTGV